MKRRIIFAFIMICTLLIATTVNASVVSGSNVLLYDKPADLPSATLRVIVETKEYFALDQDLVNFTIKYQPLDSFSDATWKVNITIDSITKASSKAVTTAGAVWKNISFDTYLFEAKDSAAVNVTLMNDTYVEKDWYNYTLDIVSSTMLMTVKSMINMVYKIIPMMIIIGVLPAIMVMFKGASMSRGKKTTKRKKRK